MSRYDYPDPGTDPAYCRGTGMAWSLDTRPPARRQTTDPHCPRCTGAGLVWGDKPDGTRGIVLCGCVKGQ